MNMKHYWVTIPLVLILAASGLISATDGITLIGKGRVGGSALDKSGLRGVISQQGDATNFVPLSLLGGFGSSFAYTGHDNVYITAPDRGPFDGLTDIPYPDRIHFMHITTDVGAAFPNIRALLLDTRLLKNEFFTKFVGAADFYDLSRPWRTLRLDPEGIRVSCLGTFFISDEYGPYLFEFGRQGHLLRRLRVPAKFLIANPSSDPDVELTYNFSGRQANRGMEGLAISPCGRFLFGIMQNALLQDNGLNPGTTSRLGLNNRILKLDRLTGRTQEFVYVLDAINRGQGVSEILAINNCEFLVIERDNRSNLQDPPQAPTRKKIYKINLVGATDVSGIDSLPAGPLPAEIVPVAKELFIDLLDPAFGLASEIAEKIEALAWGPDLPDGRHALYVASDNDLNPALDTQIYSFAIDGELLPNFEKQVLPWPLYPTWLVKKALRAGE